MHYQKDSLWTILNMKWSEEELEDKIWMIHVSSFDVPITDQNSVVKNARVSNSRIHRNFKSWRGEIKKNNDAILHRRQVQRGNGGLLLKWGRK